MMHRFGSVATSVLLGIASLGMIGTAGYMMTTGNTVCSLVGGGCDKGDADTASTTVLASTGAAEGKSCCPLGSLASAKGECSGETVPAAEIMAASTEAKSSCCSGKSSCGDKNVEVVAASTKADCASSCGDKASCSDKNVDVVAASTKASCCGGGCDKADASVTSVAAKAADCGSSCGDKAACNGADVFNTRMATIMAAFSPVAAAECGSSCGDKAACGSKNVDVVAASAEAKSCCGGCDKADASVTSVAAKAADCGSSCSDKASCSEGNVVMASAKADCCPMLASRGVAHMAAATTPVFVPAAFFSTASIDMSNLTEAGCCRSAAENCSGKSTCGDAHKACCSKGEKTVASAN